MELINVAVARSLWHFGVEELNRKGIRVYPNVVERIRERYDFDEEDESAKPEDRFKLKNGAFKGSHGEEVPIRLEIYNDGLLAETISTTEDSDAFLEDLLTWLNTEFGMNYYPSLVRKKGYQSEVVIRSDVPLGSVCDKLKRFAERLSTIPLFETIEPQELVSLYFGATLKTQASFTFERRSAAPFDERKFYCRAPLSTSQHLDLIRDFESIMSG